MANLEEIRTQQIAERDNNPSNLINKTSEESLLSMRQ
jgi:hypothetical protein